MVLKGSINNSYIEEYLGKKNHFRPANDPSMRRGAFTANFVAVERRNSFSTIYLVLFINKERLKLNSGVKIKSKYWDKKTRSIKSSHPQGSDLNLFLRQLISKANDIAVRYRLESIQLTKELFI